MSDLLEDVPLILIQGQQHVMVRDAAKVLGVSRQWIAMLIESKRLVARAFGPRTLVVTVASLEQYQQTR